MDRFELPEDLNELTPDELAGLREQALAEFDELVDGDERNAETLARMRELADGLDSINEAVQAHEAVNDEIDSLAERVRGSEDDDEDDDDDAVSDDAPEASDGTDADDDGVDASDEQPESTADDVDADPDDDAADPDGDTPVSASDAEDATVTEITEAVDDPDDDEDLDAVPNDQNSSDTNQEQMPVAASSSNTSPSATALNAHRSDDSTATSPPARTRAVPTIVAAANLPSHNTGAELSMADVADALVSRLQTFPRKFQADTRLQAGVATIHKDFDDDEIMPDGATIDEFVPDESTLPGGSLVAAGSWCAPSETLYDLCTHASTDGLISLPTRQISRGGIQHTTGPDFRSVYDGTGYFTATEAEAEAGDFDGEGGDKPCMVVPCPAFVNDRLDLAGLCITGDILMDTAYPEATQNFVEQAVIAHGHRVNFLVIDSLVNGSDAVAPTAFGGSTTSILGAVDLQIEDMRQRNRMAREATIEAVFPYWVHGLIRADLSNRLGVDMLSVTNSMINGWFTDRRANPQFVYDWQDDYTDAASGFGSSSPQVAWPDTVDFLLYPNGTWVKGESDVITLDAIYDSNKLPQNNYTALFTEEGWLTAKRCHDSRIVSVSGWNCFGDTAAGTACPE